MPKPSARPKRSVSSKRSDREYDIVLLGATGFTGGLTAEYMASVAKGTRWAIAGRSQDKLDAVRERLGGGGGTKSGAAGELGVIKADITDRESIRRVAESARVLITTVGPYINYGEPVVAACAAAGTDYVDLTGEPGFVDLMWLRYQEQAVRSGARLVHCCGFDSIPHDLGVLYTVQQLPEGVPIKVEGYVKAGATVSGGTFHSAVHIMSGLRQSRQLAGQRRKLEGTPPGRRIRGITGRPRHDDTAGGWILPAPTIDPAVVLHSARELERYGPDFSYGHYLVNKRLPVLAGLAVGAGTLTALVQLPPARNLLLKLKDPGDGPTEEQREKSWFRVRFSGEADGRRVVTEVSGGDPGYGETSKMLSEAALCLAHDQLPERRGQLTPASAMGQALIDRLQGAGIEFRTLPS